MRIWFGNHKGQNVKDLKPEEASALHDWVGRLLENPDAPTGARRKEFTRLFTELDQTLNPPATPDDPARALALDTLMSACAELGVPDALVERYALPKIRALLEIGVGPEDIVTVAAYCRLKFSIEHFPPLLDITHITEPTRFAMYLAAVRAEEADLKAKEPAPSA